jgi:cyclopropane-fatty-acyl-phospholipid synthase
MNSRIFQGGLFHARHLDHALSFGYPMYMLWLDLDELPQLDRQTRWFKHNRRGILSIRDADYLDATERPIKEKLFERLQARGIARPDGPVMLLTSPRYFGYVFNPVSFYAGYHTNGALAFAAAEVNNTFNEKHFYLLDVNARVPDEREGYRFMRKKDFHVSPFMDLAGHYDFLFRFPDNGIDIHIDLIKQNANAFHARLNGHFSEMNPTNLRRILWKYPLDGFLTMTRITMQAAKLYSRGATVYERPTPVSPDTIGHRAVAGKPPLSARLVLNALARIQQGALVMTLPNGEQQWLGESDHHAPVTMAVRDWRVFKRLLMDGDIGLGETYMNGDWTTNDLTGLIQLLIDNRHAVDDVEDGHWLKQWRNRVLSWLRRNSITGSRKNISAHYDLSNDLFALFLDPSMTYSSACYESPDQSLADAQQVKYRKLCEKVELKDGDHVLEIGCGWGGFACFAAQYARCRVTAVTISQEQFDYAQARIKREGVADRVTLLLQDYRTLAGEKYDGIVSIEMFEAVGYEYYPAYFKAVDRLLKPGRRFAIQTITFPDQEFHHYRKTFDWIRKYIFPGGLLPSIEVIARVTAKHTGLVIQDLENIGLHYARTLREWRERFNDQIEAVRALGLDVRFERMWNFYLSYCEAAFASRYLGDAQIVFSRAADSAIRE